MKTFQGAKTKIFTVTNKRSPSPHWSFLLPKPEKKVFAFKSARALFVGQWFSTCEPEVESRTQGSRPRPKTEKKIRGQGQGQPFRGQTLSRQRTGMLQTKDTSASALQKKKKKRSSQKFFRRSPKKKKKKRERSSHKFFKRSPQKNVFQKIFQALHKIFNNSKNSAVLESRTGQFSRT